MTTEDLLASIRQLVDEERSLEGSHEPASDRHARRVQIEEQLDQCWDLLRQRQAAREAGRDPRSVHVRPIGQVEGYLG